MQRTRRYTSSTVSHSSHSNATLRTRKRSRASSAGGDSLAVNRESKSFGEASRRRSKNCGPKGNLPSKLRPPLRKAPKFSKVLRPSFGSLQNAVVLAPFHTLKRCFQTKLLDLYSLEKMKKINHKTKMAKKQNMSFEYDIIELKPPETVVKNESKTTKKPKPKSRSATYCQCNKTRSKTDQKKSQNSGQKKRMTESETLTSRGAFRELTSKRRKLNGPTPTILNAELSPRLDFYQPNDLLAFSDAIPSASVASSRSKCDSWETYSNSASYKEEHLEGSLAISTTSYDSYLEHFDKSSLGQSDSSWRGNRRIRSEVTPERLAADLLPKPNADSLRYSSGCVERKSSDDRIVDFLDREPQNQKVTESNQHLLPLRRQSKTKAKKPETDSGTSYYFRSHSTSKEKIPFERKFKLQGCGCAKPKTLKIEVATQMEGSTLSASTSTSTTWLTTTPKEPAPHLEVTQEELPGDGNFSTTQKLELPNVREPFRETPITRLEPVDIPLDEVDIPPLDLNSVDEQLDRGSTELVGGLEDTFQRPTDSQQDNNSDFIFGPRSIPSRLGESCQFSFGPQLDED